MCLKYKCVDGSCTEETVTHPSNAVTNLQQNTPSPEPIKPLLLVPLTARHIALVCVCWLIISTKINTAQTNRGQTEDGIQFCVIFENETSTQHVGTNNNVLRQHWYAAYCCSDAKTNKMRVLTSASADYGTFGLCTSFPWILWISVKVNN